MKVNKIIENIPLIIVCEKRVDGALCSGIYLRYMHAMAKDGW